MVDLRRRLAAEALGTAFLLASVVGSGIMGVRLAGGNLALALLVNTISTGMALVALLLTFGPVSGAHFNPAVTAVTAWLGGLRWREAGAYVVAQTIGAFGGVGIAHLMFGEKVYTVAQNARGGSAQIFSEFVATFGLLAVILGVSRHQASKVPYAVAGYVMSAYWFTASTSFANPAVTVSRTLSDSFAGIRPIDAPGFLLGQVLGMGCAALLFRWLLPPATPIRSPDHSIQ